MNVAIGASANESVTAAALGVIVLGERLGPSAAIGALLLLAGLAIIGLRPATAETTGTKLP